MEEDRYIIINQKKLKESSNIPETFSFHYVKGGSTPFAVTYKSSCRLPLTILWV